MFLNNKKLILINLYFFIISISLVFFYLGKENLSIYDFDWLLHVWKIWRSRKIKKNVDRIFLGLFGCISAPEYLSKSPDL